MEGEFYAGTRYEDVKEDLCEQESFNDMIAIIAGKTGLAREQAATAVLSLLVDTTARQLSNKMEEVDRSRHRFR